MDQSLRLAAEYIASHKDPDEVHVVRYHVASEYGPVGKWCGKEFTFNARTFANTADISSGELAQKVALAYFDLERQHKKEITVASRTIADLTQRLKDALYRLDGQDRAGSIPDNY
jgi:hypothetical protein